MMPESIHGSHDGSVIFPTYSRPAFVSLQSVIIDTQQTVVTSVANQRTFTFDQITRSNATVVRYTTFTTV